MDTIALVNGEQGKAVVFFIPRWHVVVGFLSEFGQLLMEISNCSGILILLLMMEPIPVSDGLDEQFGNAPEPDQVVDVEALDEIGHGAGGDRVSVRSWHEHRDVVVRRME